MNIKNKMTPVMIDTAKTALREAYYLGDYAISHEVSMDGDVYIIDFKTEVFEGTPGHHLDITLEVGKKELEIRLMGHILDGDGEGQDDIGFSYSLIAELQDAFQDLGKKK